nr:cupin domain-containing protein [uncultured Allomuricauda sp.]
MRHFVCCLLLSLSSTISAQNADYPIKSFLEEGVKAPNTHHLGEAWLNFLLQEEDGLDYNITQATFSANSTLDWHKHSTPQVLIVLEGKGYYQERGKDPIIIKKGDVVQCQKDTEHWHTSSKDSKVSYLAIYGNSPTIWTEKVTREYYDSVTKKIDQK